MLLRGVKKSMLLCPRCMQQGRKRRLIKKDNNNICTKCGFKYHYYDETLTALLQRYVDTAHENITRLIIFDIEKISNFRLQSLFWEAYSSALIGNYHASLMVQGALMENLVKEIVYINEGKYNELEFSPNLKHALKKGYLTKQEYQILDRVRKFIRNPYAHSNMNQITKGLEMPIYWIEAPYSPVSKEAEINEVIQKMMTGHYHEGIINERSGEVRQFVLNNIDEHLSISTLNEAYGFLIEMALLQKSTDGF